MESTTIDTKDEIQDEGDQNREKGLIKDVVKEEINEGEINIKYEHQRE